MFGREVSDRGAPVARVESRRRDEVKVKVSRRAAAAEEEAAVSNAEPNVEEAEEEEPARARRRRRRSLRPNPRLSNPPKHLHGEQVAAGWPSWLSEVAGEAINGLTPRRADTFEKLNKVNHL